MRSESGIPIMGTVSLEGETPEKSLCPQPCKYTESRQHPQAMERAPPQSQLAHILVSGLQSCEKISVSC